MTEGADHLEQLQCIAASEKKNPNLVHASVPPEWRPRYYQLLFKHAQLLAVCLADLEEGAHVPPLVIRTFGAPVARPPLRLSPAHKKFVVQEV